MGEDGGQRPRSAHCCRRIATTEGFTNSKHYWVPALSLHTESVSGFSAVSVVSARDRLPETAGDFASTQRDQDRLVEREPALRITSPAGRRVVSHRMAA